MHDLWVVGTLDSTVLTTHRKCACKKSIQLRIIQKASQPIQAARIFKPRLTKFELDCYVLHGVPRGFVSVCKYNNLHVTKNREGSVNSAVNTT